MNVVESDLKNVQLTAPYDLLARGTFLESSTRHARVTGNVVIGATKQLPQEGGPEKYSEVSRVLLEQAVPDLFERVDKKCSDCPGDYER